MCTLSACYPPKEKYKMPIFMKAVASLRLFFPSSKLLIFYVILARMILIITFLRSHVIVASRRQLLSLASCIETVANYRWNLKFLYFDYQIIFVILSCRMEANQYCFCLTPVLQSHMPLESKKLQA